MYNDTVVISKVYGFGMQFIDEDKSLIRVRKGRGQSMEPISFFTYTCINIQFWL